MSRTPEKRAIAAALAQAERDVACGINPSAEPLRVALHKAVDVIASVSAERDAARAEVATLRARLVEGKEQAERERADVVAWLRARADHEAQDAAHAQNAEDYQSAMGGREVCRLAVSAFEAGEHEGAATPK